MFEGDEEHSGEYDSKYADGPDFELGVWSEAGEVFECGLAGGVFVYAEESGYSEPDSCSCVEEFVEGFHRESPSHLSRW